MFIHIIKPPTQIEGSTLSASCNWWRMPHHGPRFVFNLHFLCSCCILLYSLCLLYILHYLMYSCMQKECHCAGAYVTNKTQLNHWMAADPLVGKSGGGGCSGSLGGAAGSECSGSLGGAAGSECSGPLGGAAEGVLLAARWCCRKGRSPGR